MRFPISSGNLPKLTVTDFERSVNYSNDPDDKTTDTRSDEKRVKTVCIVQYGNLS